MSSPARGRAFLRTLRGQLILGMALVNALLMLLFVGDVVRRQERMIVLRQVEYTSALSHTLATSCAGWISAQDLSGLQEVIDAQRRYPGLEFAMVLDAWGRILAHSDPTRIGLYLADLPSRPEATVLNQSLRLVDVAVPATIGGTHVGWARVGLNQGSAREALAALKRNAALYVAGAILLSSALAWVLGDRLTRRLRSLQEAADQVHGGDLGIRTQVAGTDEVASLARGFNRMLEALEERALQRDRAARDLRESTAFLDAIIHTLPLTVFVKDAVNLHYVALNRAGERLLGLKAEEVLGRGDADLLPPEQAAQFQAADRRVLESRNLVDIPEERLQVPGGERLLRTLKVPILDDTGAPRYLLGISQDITEQKRLEEDQRRLEGELHRVQRLESLGSLAGGVAHDMNNVVGAILALATIHQEKAEPGSRLQRDMGTIITACLRARTLVRGLLGFARQELAEITLVDLNTLVQEEVALLERSTLGKVRLVMELDPQLHPLTGDPAALSHALMNLCVNAVDAMPEGGTLSLRTWNGGDGRIHLEVADTGTGMTPEVLEHALEPFFSTKPQGKGTGLGLALVYGTVKAHQGTLELLSDPGRGTRALLHFPSAIPSSAETTAPAIPGGEAARLQVLIVDDDELVSTSTQALLESLGHAVATASSGEAALERLAQGPPPDAVILDLNMPGLGGEGTLPRLRELHPDLPVFLATGRADQHAMDLAKRIPRTTLLAKPFTRDELAARLEALTPSRMG